MLRRVIVLGLVVTLVSTLAAFAAVGSSTEEAEAQTSAYPMDYLCLDYYTGLYKGSFTANCPPYHQLLQLPDDYPLSLCASAYFSYFRKPLPNGECQSPTLVRIDLPSLNPVNICYIAFTGRIRPPLPYPDGTCGNGLLVSLPQGLIVNPDSYGTLGNVDIDVPADAGVLANDGGEGIEVVAYDAFSVNGGEVNMNPDGSFTYTPPAPDPFAFNGVDNFTYTVQEARDGLTEVVNVSISVASPIVWFVDADAAQPGDGRRLTPFNSIQALNGIGPDNSEHFIFLYEAETSYVANFELEYGQYLVGQQVDLAEILESAFASSDLQGLNADSLPPYVVLPDAVPGIESPLLEGNGDVALDMADQSTAVGLTIDGLIAPAVSAGENVTATLDRVHAYGGSDGDGAPGVVVDGANLTIVNSYVAGGDGGEFAEISERRSTLQIPGGSGYGGEGVLVLEGELTVTSSEIRGGDGTTLSNDIESTTSLLLDPFDDGGDGGTAIAIVLFAQITVNGESTVIGGNGGYGFDYGGYGGDGIGAYPFLAGSDQQPGQISSNLQGEIEDDAPFIHISGASLVEGGLGGDSDDIAGDGGDGISATIFLIDVLENSTVRGGNGGSGYYDGGYGGTGILNGDIGTLLTNPAGSSLAGSPDPDEVTVINVDGSTVESGDGGAAVEGYGGDGGDGIVLAFGFSIDIASGSSLQGPGIIPTLVTEVTNSTVTAGNGGATESTYGGLGGWGIVMAGIGEECCTGTSSLQGPGIPAFDIDVNVTGSTVYGGVGGAGEDVAGNGGIGIANGIPPFSPEISSEESTLRRSELLGPGLDFLEGGNLTVVNSNIYGGAAGTASDEDGGAGGPGIVSVGPEYIQDLNNAVLQGIPDFQKTTVVTNSTVEGGSSGSGYYSGGGGDGIATFGVNLQVNQGSNVRGGAGADSDAYAGDGGFGLYVEESSVTVDGSTISGAAGGDSLAGSGSFEGGYGGEGIYGYGSEITVQNASLTSGGDGGASPANSGTGGDGIFTEMSNVTITDSTANGGNGGDARDDTSADGGHGVHVTECYFATR
ncbi:MAG: Ig-like domain-containing protein [Thermomicrobiales bacterium]